MTHTSTEQQNKEKQEALDVSAFLSKYADAPSCQAAYHLKRLVFRVQELEASQAQRVPLDAFDVGCLVESAGYSQIEAQRKADFINGIRYAEIRHGITQNKQD